MKNNYIRLIGSMAVLIFFITGCGKDDITKELETNGCIDIHSKYININGIEKSYYYTGKAINPTPSITTIEKKYDDKIKYSYHYENNIDVGTAKVIIESESSFLCSGEVSFEITYNPADMTSLDEASITGIDDSYAYTGTVVEPIPIVKINNSEIGKDNYDINYSDNIEIGVASITITGKGKYSGSKTVQFAILNRPVITCLDPTYNGNKQVIATCEGGTIDGVKEQINAGKYTINCTSTSLISDKELYMSARRECQIKRIDISQATVSEFGVSDKLEERIRVILNGTVLARNQDYRVNVTSLVGKERIYEQEAVINGTGNYTGTIYYKKDMRRDLAYATIEPIGPIEYTGTEIIPEEKDSPKVKLLGQTLVLNKDYTIVRYEDNINPGGAKIVIIGKGDYTGTNKGIAFYIYKKNCNNSSKAVDVILEGVTQKDKNNMYSAEDDKENRYKLESGHTYVELYPGESISFKVTIPSICSKIISRDIESPRDSNSTKGWDKYFTKTYSDLDYTNNVKGTFKDVEYDENGNVTYTFTLTAGSKTTPKDWWAKFSTYRRYVTEKMGKINYTGGIISAKIVEKKSDIIEAKKVLSDKCCCIYSDLTKCSWRENIDDCPKEQPYEDVSTISCNKHIITPTPTVTPQVTSSPKPTSTPTPKPTHAERTPTPKPTHAERTPTPKPATYSCSMNYNSSTGKLTITGSASNGSKVTRTIIDGAATSSIIPITSKTYSGIVYFADGKTATCYKYVTISSTPTPKPTSYEINGKDPVCGKVEGASTTWITGNRYICVSCSTCQEKKYCNSFSSSPTGDIKTGSITIKGTNGKTKSCVVNVYLKKKSVDSRACCCTSDQRTNCKMVSGSCDKTYKVPSSIGYCQ